MWQSHAEVKVLCYVTGAPQATWPALVTAHYTPSLLTSLSGLLPAVNLVFSSASGELESKNYMHVWYKMRRVHTNWTFSLGD